MIHPLTTFPALLTFGLLSPLILRLVAGAFVIYLGYIRYKKPMSWTCIFYIIPGVLVVLGLYTQVASIISIGALKWDFYLDYYKNRMAVPIPQDKKIMYGTVIVILISLLFTGPGFIAFDLPL